VKPVGVRPLWKPTRWKRGRLPPQRSAPFDLPAQQRPEYGASAHKRESLVVNAFFRELLQTGIYKRSQGKIARQITFAAFLVVVVLGLWRLSEQFLGSGPYLQFGLPLALLLCGFWICFRLVNLPTFADFLIAVEAEMNKVSWPTRTELYRGSVVVLVVIFAMAGILFFFDLFWIYLFSLIGIIN